MRKLDRRGFSLVELLTALLIVATLVRISIPQVNRVLLRARAASVVGDMNTIRVAATAYLAEYHEWPADANGGEVPTGMEQYLPQGFSFDRGEYQLDWENWILPGGLPKHPETNVLLGVSIVTEDEYLANAVVGLLGDNWSRYTLGSNYTFILEQGG
jgi:prepilin-type N-terminal cleavage/methylation domain-containing protein